METSGYNNGAPPQPARRRIDVPAVPANRSPGDRPPPATMDAHQILCQPQRPRPRRGSLPSLVCRRPTRLLPTTGDVVFATTTWWMVACVVRSPPPRASCVWTVSATCKHTDPWFSPCIVSSGIPSSACLPCPDRMMCTYIHYVSSLCPPVQTLPRTGVASWGYRADSPASRGGSMASGGMLRSQ